MAISIDEQLGRMKSLMTYGQEINENSARGNYSIEYHAMGPDGKSYGIIRECNKYYIKSANKDKETLAEAYDYIGGYMNKKAYEYTSYANALKNFELKMASLNEACDAKVNIETLDPFKREEFIVEGTEKMREEIARQRQIMHNVGVLMNEETGIGKTPITSQPESEHANSEDKDTPFTDGVEASLDKDPKFNAEKPEKQGVPFTGEKKAEKGTEVKVEGSVASEKPAGGKVARVNEGCECGECDFAEGVPCEGGIGDADTDHNNEPFNNEIKEGCCKEELSYSNPDHKLADGTEDPGFEDVESPLCEGEEDMEEPEEEEEEDEFNEDDFDIEDEDESDEDGDDFDVEGLEDEPEIEGEEELDFEDEEGDLDENDPEAIRAEIERLQGILDGIEGDEEDEEEPLMESKSKFMNSIVESVVRDILKEEEENYYSLASLIATAANEMEYWGYKKEAKFLENYLDNSQRCDNGDLIYNEKISGILARIWLEAERKYDSGVAEDWDDYDDFRDLMHEAFDTYEREIGNLKSDADDFDLRNQAQWVTAPDDIKKGLRESQLRNIVAESIKKILKEEKTVLHDFGKHPGYRKKPMTLPATGSDETEHGKDWNDASTHTEQPFGQKIGKGDPFNVLVDTVTKDVMVALKEGKKKVK